MIDFQLLDQVVPISLVIQNTIVPVLAGIDFDPLNFIVYREIDWERNYFC